MYVAQPQQLALVKHLYVGAPNSVPTVADGIQVLCRNAGSPEAAHVA
jgi:hypothetical protein